MSSALSESVRFVGKIDREPSRSSTKEALCR